MDVAAELVRRVRAAVAGFPEEAVQDALALIALQSGDASAATLAFLGAFAARAGVQPDDAPEALAQKIAAHVRAHPPPVELLAAIADAVSGLVREGALDRGSAFAQFAGDAGRAGVLGGGERPAGTIAAGPLAAVLAGKHVGTKGRGP